MMSGDDADLVEGSENADMRPAARGAAAERETDLRPLALTPIGPVADSAPSDRRCRSARIARYSRTSRPVATPRINHRVHSTPNGASSQQ